jgi:hypothetical protein
VRCVIGTLTLAIQTTALIEEPLIRVPGGLSANRIATCKAWNDCLTRRKLIGPCGHSSTDAIGLPR